MRNILLCAVLIFASRAFAKQSDFSFRAIVVADTKAERIEKSTQSDLENIKKSLYSIARQLHLKPYIQILSGKECSVHMIKNGDIVKSCVRKS